jgi:hypothetical protein
MAPKGKRWTLSILSAGGTRAQSWDIADTFTIDRALGVLRIDATDQKGRALIIMPGAAAVVLEAQ